jgi:hypothetical protein
MLFSRVSIISPYFDRLLFLLGPACFSKQSSQYNPSSSTRLGFHLISPVEVIMLSRLPQPAQMDRRFVFVLVVMPVHLIA